MSERGSATIWVLGLSLLLLLFGGLALDYWRGLALQRELAAVADSAALAGASGIDEDVYRATGAVLLDASRSRNLALASVGSQGLGSVDTVIEVTTDLQTVTVTVSSPYDPLLIGVFIGDDTPILVRGEATASPRLQP